MNRVIKFRAWSPAGAGWKMFGNEEALRLLYNNASESKLLHRDEVKIMQFTGLTDKNGKEIYEGDILFGKEEGNGETTAWTDVYYIVFFKDGCFKVRERRIDEDSCWCDYLHENGLTEEYEVIGNIYENSELLTP